MTIDDATVQLAWEEVGGSQDGHRAKLLMEEFARTQPALAEFLMQVLQKVGGDGADLGYFTGLVVWRCYVKSMGFPLAPITTDQVVEEYGKTEAWLEALTRMDEILLAKKIRDPKEYAQPTVMEFVLEAIFEANEDQLEVDPEDQERLFITLKVISDCLNRVKPLAN